MLCFTQRRKVSPTGSGGGYRVPLDSPYAARTSRMAETVGAKKTATGRRDPLALELRPNRPSGSRKVDVAGANSFAAVLTDDRVEAARFGWVFESDHRLCVNSN